MEKRSKVTVVEGKAGSGKSIFALEAMRRIKLHKKDQSKIIYLCRGRGLAAFAKYQTEMMGICVDIQTLRLERRDTMNEDYFCQYTDVFIDDAHALPLTGQPNWKDMYHSLFSSLWKPNSHCYILLDPDMQDYRGCIATHFSKEIQSIARQYSFIRRQDVKTETLGKILRNSSRICQFIGANLGDELDELRCIRNLPEDGVYLYIIEDFKNVHRKDAKTLKQLKLLLRTMLKGTVYEENEEPDGSDEEKNNENYDDDHDHDKDGADDENTWSDRDVNSAVIKLEVATLVSRLRYILDDIMYQERDVTILTENTKDKTWIQDMLRCDKYSIQEATRFPVEHIVVDTLGNFEGLESPVILFIVPYSWATGYVGSLKYRLCIATRAISRLEFLVPWDPTGREQDLAQLRRAFQTEVSRVTLFQVLVPILQVQ